MDIFIQHCVCVLRVKKEGLFRIPSATSVALNKELLAPCSAARGRYSAFLQKMQKERLSAMESVKSKSTVDKIDLLKSKRCRLEKDIDDLTKCLACQVIRYRNACLDLDA